MHGGVARGDLGTENVGAVTDGIANLRCHIENIQKFGVPPVVAINRFTTDTDAEIAAIVAAVAETGADVVECTHWADGSAGTEALARKVVEIADSGAASFAPIYPDDMGLFDKINTVAREIYRASEAVANKSLQDQLHRWEEEGYGQLPVCMAKTQYSFSTDPDRKGAPSDHIVPVREVRLSAGAEFVVAICGDIMTMPGLPRVPAANSIRLGEGGIVEGLF
jgi:formate--tetrahydrofolate ligase